MKTTENFAIEDIDPDSIVAIPNRCDLKFGEFYLDTPAPIDWNTTLFQLSHQDGTLLKMKFIEGWRYSPQEDGFNHFSADYKNFSPFYDFKLKTT